MSFSFPHLLLSEQLNMTLPKSSGLCPLCKRTYVAMSHHLMVEYLQLVWTEMGLPGRPTFIDIRSAVATHAKNFHPPEIRSRLSSVMCHDTATADKFYVRHLDMEQSLEIRRLRKPHTVPLLLGRL
ncbi:hypothetical protein XENORESO_014197 [Xenotaenia resolanae]|uniref:Uncharacterized protein n=1 Tax=Xenotaenia resolanae TaxID=208358 RepID=A0ABV0WRD9_9TELE